MDFGSTFLAILTGLGLSVACGFRVFLPPLAMGIAAYTGNMELAEGFTWFGEWPALILFGVATVCEIILSKFPGIAQILDGVKVPLAVVAGTVLEAAVLEALMVTDMSPLLQWSLAAIAGGGPAGLVHGGDAVLRFASTVTTAGMSEPLFSTAEDAGSGIFSFLAIILPMLPPEYIVFIAILFILPVLLSAGVITFAIKKWIVKRRQMPA